PSGRFMTAYNFTNGYAVAATGKQINYILVDPEAQVSRVKYSYIQMFEPGSDSRTADRYLYQNRRFNGTFGIDELLAKGCRINAAS
ncbi:MAG: capsid protein, partial [Ruminococcus sp.]|nr:capsid protein [Ruminococcus sp.]